MLCIEMAAVALFTAMSITIAPTPSVRKLPSAVAI